MSGTEQVSNNKYYYNYNGKKEGYNQAFRTEVGEHEEGAIERKNKLGRIVHEKEVPAIFGKIEKVSLVDSSYGKQILIQLDPDEDGKNPLLAFSVESSDGRDILVKLPNIKAGEEVRFMPYRFVPKGETEEKAGLSLHTKDDEGKFTVKVGNFFLEDKKPLHGYPTIDWEKSSESAKKKYFIDRDEFLLNYLQEKVIPTFNGVSQEKTDGYEYPEEELSPESIPF